MSRKAIAWLVTVALAAVGVLLLRAEVMTVPGDLPAQSYTDVVLHADTREDPRLLPEMTRGLVSVCRLLVDADVVERSFTVLGDGDFAFTVQPGLGEFDVREMRGCLRDARVQHLLVDVREIDTVLP